MGRHVHALSRRQRFQQAGHLGRVGAVEQLAHALEPAFGQRFAHRLQMALGGFLVCARCSGIGRIGRILAIERTQLLARLRAASANPPPSPSTSP